jgi:HEPN domain-containing protein
MCSFGTVVFSVASMLSWDHISRAAEYFNPLALKPKGITLANRAGDWLKQAEGDLGHSRNAEKAGDYDWACFAAQQSAEKAVKGLILAKGGEGWGHSVLRLLKDLSQLMTVSESLIRSAMRLDKHYIPTRYPNGFDTGAPKEYYSDEDANQAIEDAKTIVDFCRQSFPDS